MLGRHLEEMAALRVLLPHAKQQNCGVELNGGRFRSCMFNTLQQRLHDNLQREAVRKLRVLQRISKSQFIPICSEAPHHILELNIPD